MKVIASPSCREPRQPDPILPAMPKVQINLPQSRTAYAPGETIAGTISWQFNEPPKHAELRLVWNTRGRGIQDIVVATTIPFDQPQASDSRPLSIVLPEAPYSFSGKLISLIWALEMVVEPGNHSLRQEITVAPESREIVIARG